MQHQYNPYDEQPRVVYMQTPSRRDPVAMTLLLGALSLAALALVLYFGRPIVAALQPAQPTAVPVATFPPRPPVALPPRQPAPAVPIAPPLAEVAPAPAITDEGARPNRHPLPTLAPVQPAVIIYPTVAPPSGVNWNSDIHVGTDGASWQSGVSVRPDPPPAAIVEYRTNDVPLPTVAPEGSRKGRKLPPKGE
jgi:hypothetical protein